MHRQRQTNNPDKFSSSYFIWVMLVGLLFALGRDLDRIFNLWLMLVPVLFLPAVMVGVFWIVALARNTWLRRWRRVTSIVVAPIAAWLILAGAQVAGITPELLRFEFGKRHYVEQIETLPRTGGPRLASFDWAQIGGAGTVNAIYTLVFDEADEIALGAEQRSGDWQNRASQLCPSSTPVCALLKPPADFAIAVKRLDGHFYLVTLAW